MNKKQKEGLVISLYEKGKTYREIAKEAGVSPNTIKAVLNKAGLDQTTSISSRVFELYSQEKTPLEVAIALGLKTDEVLRYHHEYFMLLGCYEFAKVYPQIKDNPWPYVNLVRLAHDSGIRDEDVLELLDIAKGHIPRVRLEYDRVKNELNTLKAELSNTARTYQQFVDRNVELKKREAELQPNIDKLEAKESELQKTISQLGQHLSVLESNVNTTNLNAEVKQEDIISSNDELVSSLNCHENESEIPDYHFQSESSCRKLVFDTKDLF